MNPLDDEQTLNDRTRVRIIVGVVLGSFIAALDTTILATVMPTIVADLGGTHLYSWVFSVYMIMTAVSMPLWGRVADIFGKKLLFFVAVALFLTGSMACGASQNLVQLIFARGLQGIGAGGLASIPFALISTVFSHADRGKALGLLSSAWGISSIVGPLLGSVIVDQFHWRWVFYLNVPIGVLAVAIIASSFTETISRSRQRIDLLGAALLCVAIVSLLLASLQLSYGAESFWRGTVPYTVVSVVTTWFFIRRERSVSFPLLDMRFFARRAFWLGNLLGFMASFAMYGIIAYVPLFSQSLRGGSAMQAGLVITPMSMGWSGASIIAGRLAHRVGEKRLILFGMVLMAAGFVMLTLGDQTAPLWYLALGVLIAGLGMGCQTPSMMLVVQRSIDQSNVGVATASQMLARTIGGAIGVSVLGVVVSLVMAMRFAMLEARGMLALFPEAVRPFLHDPQRLLSPSIRVLLSRAQVDFVLDAFTSALHSVFLISLTVIMLGLVFAWFLPVHESTQPSVEPPSVLPE